jgi:sirohydrochlorin cobaltochelatase
MKHFFITLYLLGISLFSSAQQEEKAALLITHYGSSDPQTRALTLDVVTREAQEAFPQFTVREAYISPIVRKRLAKEGVYKDSPTDALLKLRAEGYQTIYVQSTTLIEGSEMTSVRRDADKLRPFFKEIKVGNPLLYSVEDCEKVIGILTAEQPEKKEDKPKGKKSDYPTVEELVKFVVSKNGQDPKKMEEIISRQYEKVKKVHPRIKAIDRVAALAMTYDYY